MPRGLSELVLPRRPMARRREEPASTGAPPRRAEPRVEPEKPPAMRAEPEAEAVDLDETDTEEEITVEAAIDERLKGLGVEAREQVLRRVVAAFAEDNVEALDLLEEEVAMAQDQAS